MAPVAVRCSCSCTSWARSSPSGRRSPTRSWARWPAKEPQHANFSSRQVAAIGNKLVYPLAIFQGITGVAAHLIARRSTVSTQPWLVAGDRPVPRSRIDLRADRPAQRPRDHLIELTSTPPPPGHAARTAAAGAPSRPSRRSSAAGCSSALLIVDHRLPDGGQARP